MPYLIDGNNVMGQRAGWQKDRDGARRRLLDELAEFGAAKGARVLVVFDGAPLQHFADGASYKAAVRVFYAARNSNADERIKAMVEASGERRTLIVVTSDRALGEYVRRCGAQVLNAREFRRRMDESAQKRDAQSASSEAVEPVTIESMPEWMRYFGVAPEDDD